MSPLRPVVVKTRRITVVLVAAAALALPVGAYRLGNRVDNNSETLCVVGEAGRDAILGGALLPGDVPLDRSEPPKNVVPGELSMFLERHGFPSYEARRSGALASAARYEHRLSEASGGQVDGDSCK